MIYTLANIRKDVRVALDENDASPELTLALDRNTISLDELIESKVVDAVTMVERQAPLHLVDRRKSIPSTTITWESEVGFGSGVVPLPKDFMRLVVFKMSDWSHSVSQPIYEFEKLYARQHSRHSGIRGTPQKPVVAIISTQTGSAIEFFSSSSSGATMERAMYIPMPILASGNIEISEQCYRSVVYTVASMVASTYKDNELASSLSTLATNMIAPLPTE